MYYVIVNVLGRTHLRRERGKKFEIWVLMRPLTVLRAVSPARCLLQPTNSYKHI